MRQTNRADLTRQIRREGRRLGLVPHFDDVTGKVYVAEMSRHISGRGVLQTVLKPTDICSVDMDHPIANVGKWRRKRYEKSLLIRVREARAKRAQEAEVRKADLWQAMRPDLLRGRRELGEEAFSKAMAEVLGVRSHSR